MIHRGSLAAKMLHHMAKLGALDGREVWLYSADIAALGRGRPVANAGHWLGRLFVRRTTMCGQVWSIHPAVLTDETTLRMVRAIIERESNGKTVQRETHQDPAGAGSGASERA